jgi:mannose-6-phosphate isomerase-like protein (cupin superfamily)
MTSTSRRHAGSSPRRIPASQVGMVPLRFTAEISAARLWSGAPSTASSACTKSSGWPVRVKRSICATPRGLRNVASSLASPGHVLGTELDPDHQDIRPRLQTSCPGSATTCNLIETSTSKSGHPPRAGREAGLMVIRAGQRAEIGRGYVLTAGQGLAEHPQDPGIKASAESTGGSLTLIESLLRSGPPRHVHDHEDESFYVLDGSLTAYCGDDVWEAGPGSFVFLPRGIPHHFTIGRSGSARVLLIVTPGGIESYFQEISAAPDEATRQRVRDKYGIHRA